MSVPNNLLICVVDIACPVLALRKAFQKPCFMNYEFNFDQSWVQILPKSYRDNPIFAYCKLLLLRLVLNSVFELPLCLYIQFQ